MSYDLSAKELKATIASDPASRLSYFVRKVKETGEIWTLADGEALLVLGIEESSQFIAIWPHPDFALSWFEDSGLEEADLVAMNAADWIESTLSELAESEIDLNVFPTVETDGKIVTASSLLERLATKAG